jgi:hypothetical protein
MKKATTLLVALAMIFGVWSCEKTKDDINKATEFDMSYSSEITIPGSELSLSKPIEITTPEISTGSSAKFSSESTASNLIDEIKMTKFNISNPSGNLDFLDSLSIYIKTAGQSDVKVAAKSNIPKGTSSIAADLGDINIKEFIFKDKIQFRITVKVTTGTTTSDQTLKLEETLHVKGKRL